MGTAVLRSNDPEYAVELREQHTGIIGGYHANKKHWNTVRPEADVPRALVLDLIDHSYERVVAGFSQKQRKALDYGALIILVAWRLQH